MYVKKTPFRSIQWDRFLIARIKEFNKNNILSNEDLRLKYFTWNWPKRSWKAAKRPVFIDYDKHRLFFVKQGLGTNKGKGIFVRKTEFLKKYKTGG